MVESQGVNPQQRSSVNADFATCASEVSVFTFKLLFSFHEQYLSYVLPNESYNFIFKHDKNILIFKLLKLVHM